MRDRLSTIFHKSHKKSELLKLVYGNQLKATKSGLYCPYSQAQICDHDKVHSNY